MADRAPIAIFDSGIGGLTVVRALRRVLPGEDLLYLGDTARVPYGGKSRETIERYSEEIARWLRAQGAKMIVVACNSASALGLPRLREVLDVPVEGVVEPGVAAALEATRSGHVAVIGTKATIGSGAYESGLHAARPSIRITAVACPLLVPLIEEGWLEDPVTDRVLGRYLEPLHGAGVDTLVLGCTHYPLLTRAIARAAGPGIALVDSAEHVAQAVRDRLQRAGLAAGDASGGSLRLLFTDTPDRFLQVATRELGLGEAPVEICAVPPLAQ